MCAAGKKKTSTRAYTDPKWAELNRFKALQFVALQKKTSNKTLLTLNNKTRRSRLEAVTVRVLFKKLLL